MWDYSKYYWTYRAARGVDLKSRFGQIVYWAIVGSYAAGTTAAAGLVLFVFGYLVLHHYGLVVD